MARRVETKHKDFSRIPHAVVDSGVLGILKPSELKVYLVINRHADYITGVAYPGYRAIIRRAGLNKNSVAEAIRGLEDKGLISKTRAGKRLGYKNVYQVNELDEKKLREMVSVYPKKMDKRRILLRGADGKFRPIPKNADAQLPQMTEGGIHPKKKDKKEKEQETGLREIQKRDRLA